MISNEKWMQFSLVVTTAMNFLFEIDKVLHEFTSYCGSGRDC